MNPSLCSGKLEPCPCSLIRRSLAQEGKMIEDSSEVSHSSAVFDSVSPSLLCEMESLIQTGGRAVVECTWNSLGD